MEFAVLTVLRTSLVLTAAWAGRMALRHASAAQRHMVWVLAVIAVLLVAPASVLTPRWDVAVTPPALAGEAQEAAPAPAQTESTAAPAAAPSAPWWVLVWAAGFLAVAARFVAGSLRVRALAAGRTREDESAAVELGSLLEAFPLRRWVRVLSVDGIAAPMTWGVLRPVVMLPAGFAEWPAGRRRSVLLHELVHVQRFDLLTGMAAQLACAVYWFNPLMWAAARELLRERERSCDDAVLRGGVAAPEYAGHLVDVVRQMRTARRKDACAPAMAEGADLEGRVRALLDRGRNRHPVSGRAAAVAAAVAVLVVLPLVALRAQAQGARGGIVGVVKDASGAVVPGCAVTARNLGGKNVEVATANPAGEFALVAVPAGRYGLEFSSRGFRMARKEVTVVAGRTERADIVLEIGGVSETLVVTGKRPSAPPPPPPGEAPRRIRVGGNVQATKLVTMLRPAYPAELQAAGVEGVVLLRAVISVTGELLNLEVANSGVPAGLAKAALDAVGQWRYQPTLLNGKPVEVMTTITVDFRLEK